MLILIMIIIFALLYKYLFKLTYSVQYGAYYLPHIIILQDKKNSKSFKHKYHFFFQLKIVFWYNVEFESLQKYKV